MSAVEGHRREHAEWITTFVKRCRSLVVGDDALVAIRAAMNELLEQHADDLALQYPAPTECTSISGQSDLLFEDHTLAVSVVHTPPDVVQPPHDHQMSAIIGGYAGVEKQRLFRRSPDGLVPIEYTGSKDIGSGDILVLGPQGIHAINAEGPQWASAVHVYLGHLSAAKRSLFHPNTFAEEPLDFARYDALCL